MSAPIFVWTVFSFGRGGCAKPSLSAVEAMLERYLAVEQFRHRAIGLGVGCGLGEIVGRDAVDRRVQRQGRFGYGEPVADFFEADDRFGFERAVAVPRLGEAEAERHSEAAGVCCGDQLFGVGAGLILETRLKTVGLVVERARLGRDMALAVLAEAFVAGRAAFPDRAHRDNCPLIAPFG